MEEKPIYKQKCRICKQWFDVFHRGKNLCPKCDYLNDELSDNIINSLSEEIPQKKARQI